MFKASDVHSLSDFQRNTKAHLERLKRTKRPTLLTVNGKGAVVVMDADSYDSLLTSLDREEANRGISLGLESMRRGEGVELEEAKAQFTAGTVDNDRASRMRPRKTKGPGNEGTST
jgi:prevent-host-death family protein